MSAAMAMPLNPLAGAAPALQNFRSHASQSAGVLRRATTGIRQAASGVDGLGGAARSAGAAVSGFKKNASAAAGSVAKLSRSANTGVRRIGTAAGKAKSSTGKLGARIGGVLALIVSMVDIAGIVGGLMGGFGIAMTLAAVAMTGINVAMRANPIGFVIGLIVPVAAYLIELAMSSETGRRIMKQVFGQVLKGFQAVWKFLSPIMKLIGKAVGTYFEAYSTVIKGALRALGSAFSGVARVGSAVSSAANSLRGIVSRVWNGLRSAVQPVIRWVTKSIPGFFTRIKDTVSGTLRGIGRMLEGGMQTVLGVVKGPINGLIAFANWIIDGLNDLSFSLLGKKFGVDLDKIPMLAEGGVVFPGAPSRAPRINPLSELEQRRVLHAPRGPQKPYRIRDFREDPGAGPRSTAEDLLFLAAAHT